MDSTGDFLPIPFNIPIIMEDDLNCNFVLNNDSQFLDIFQPLTTVAECTDLINIENFETFNNEINSFTLDRKASKFARKRKIGGDNEIVMLENKKARNPFSIVNRISKVSPSLKRSFSLRDKSRLMTPAKTSYSSNCNTPQRIRKPTERLIPEYWSETVPNAIEQFTRQEIKLQEAIFTLYRTEIEHSRDLQMISRTFIRPLLNLDLVDKRQHALIFRNLEQIIPLHESFVIILHGRKNSQGIFSNIASDILEWVPTIRDKFLEYCPNLIMAREVLETAKLKPAFSDYLQRCYESEFTRKIDLWTFLDSPRSRLMKYPILLKEIARLTVSSEEAERLQLAINLLEELLIEIDKQTGFAKCNLIRSSLHFLTDMQKIPEIFQSQLIHFTGEMRNRHSTKLTVFLFDKAVVLTRVSNKHDQRVYTVYRQPIPLKDVTIESINECDARQTGSLRKLSKNQLSGKPLIRLSHKLGNSPSITLECHSDFDRKAWLDAFTRAKSYV